MTSSVLDAPPCSSVTVVTSPITIIIITLRFLHPFLAGRHPPSPDLISRRASLPPSQSFIPARSLSRLRKGGGITAGLRGNLNEQEIMNE